MAAAQVAKKLKDRRQKQTLEEIFRKVNFKIQLRTGCTLACCRWTVMEAEPFH